MAGGMDVQVSEKHAKRGMPIDGEGHMINMEVQPNKRGMQQKQEMMRLDDGDGDGDDDVSVGTFQSTRSGKAPKSAHRNTERHKGDKKYLAKKIAKSQRLAEDDAVSVGGASSRSLERVLI